MAGDTMKENAMLKSENMMLRQRVRVLQETIESMTARNAVLQADKDRLTLTSVTAAGNVKIFLLEWSHSIPFKWGAGLLIIYLTFFNLPRPTAATAATTTATA